MIANTKMAIAAKNAIIEHAINRMFDEAEKRGCRPLPAVLDTTLGDGVAVMHQCLRERLPEAWKTQQRAKRYHLTMFALEDSDPWDERLMKLH
jgi:hypothetical protein